MVILKGGEKREAQCDGGGIYCKAFEYNEEDELIDIFWKQIGYWDDLGDHYYDEEEV
jgi:hypothetical protein